MFECIIKPMNLVIVSGASVIYWAGSLIILATI